MFVCSRKWTRSPKVHVKECVQNSIVMHSKELMRHFTQSSNVKEPWEKRLISLGLICCHKSTSFRGNIFNDDWWPTLPFMENVAYHCTFSKFRLKVLEWETIPHKKEFPLFAKYLNIPEKEGNIKSVYFIVALWKGTTYCETQILHRDCVQVLKSKSIVTFLIPFFFLIF